MKLTERRLHGFRRVIRFIENNPLKIPRYNGTGVTHPSMLYFPERIDGYNYWMVYTPYPPASEEEPCIVRSNNGVDFVDTGILNPVVTRTEDWEDVIHDPDWIKDGDTWYMYYGAVSTKVPWVTKRLIRFWNVLTKIMYTEHHIAYVESTDGKIWNNKQKVLDHNTIVSNCKINGDCIDRGGMSPAPIKVGNTYYVFFTGRKASARARIWGIYYASGSSPTDLSIGNNGNPILTKTPNSYDDPFFQHLDVFFWKGSYWLIYQCSTRNNSKGENCEFALAKFKGFPDVLSKCSENPIMSYNDDDAGDWEKGGCYKPGPVVVGDKLFLYYSARSKEPRSDHRIGKARILFVQK